MQEFMGIIVGLFLFFCTVCGGVTGAICGLGALLLLAVMIGAPQIGFFIIMIIALAFSIGE